MAIQEQFVRRGESAPATLVMAVPAMRLLLVLHNVMATPARGAPLTVTVPEMLSVGAAGSWLARPGWFALPPQPAKKATEHNIKYQRNLRTANPVGVPAGISQAIAIGMHPPVEWAYP